MNSQIYEEGVEWLFQQAPNYQIDGKKAYKPGLENITKLCLFFGNPQEKLKTIHIGGTNGKGSTSNMVASVLQESGYKIGLFNSPHLIDFTERIKVNGKNCEKGFVVRFIEKLKKLPSDIRPSFFEFTTVMAFCYFEEMKVDFAIIEVGLGGRLDSTNIITPLVSAITNVDLDHQDILGETIEKIATEKAGIIKQNIPIISGDSSASVKEIIQKTAAEKKSKFIDASLLNVDCKTDLKGTYQLKNIKTAFAVIQELRNSGVIVSESEIENGFKNVYKNTGFIGRWFIFSEKPLIICDTAHNSAGWKEIISQLSQHKENKHFILGFVKGKVLDDLMEILPKKEQYYFVKPQISRGRHPEDYEELLKKHQINYKIFGDVQSAFLHVFNNIQNNEMIFIGGSNFIVGEFLQKNLVD